MAYNTLNGSDGLGIKNILNFPNLDTPIFYPMFLFTVFFVFTSLSFFREVSREGKGNMLSSLAVGGFASLSAATILSLLGLIQTTVLVTTVVASLVFMVLFLLSGRQ